MRIRQYVELAIVSSTVDAAQVTAALGVQPDEISVLGSRRAQPPVPVEHAWLICDRTAGRSITDQVRQVLGRIAPVAGKVQALVAEFDVSVVLSMVRYFDDADGDTESLDEATTADGGRLVKVPGQHQLLGWALDPDQVQLLAVLGASLSADEYG